jgi:hypothetical protein
VPEIAMPSESARAASRAEARFRIAAPNSMPRQVKILALDERAAPLVDRLVGADPRRRKLDLAAYARPADGSVLALKDWMSRLAGRARALIADIAPGDLVVMIATAGEDAESAALIGEACRHRGVPITALIVDSLAKSDAELSHTLGQLRPYAAMLVVARGKEYVDAMLAALRV